jgi:hypothetical protein
MNERPALRPWGNYNSLVPHDLRTFPWRLKTITTAGLDL